MKVVRPLATALTASTVAENDYPAWSAGTTYTSGARVIIPALHRVFESVVADNQGHDPATAGTSYWIDAGPTNRWAMFDQAAGPATIAAAPIVVTIALADDADTLGLVDVQADSVRLQIVAAGATLLDETRAAPRASEVFLGLPAGSGRAATVTVTPASGANAVVGKLITGAALDLGTLADAPTITLTDFSRRETDAFGVTTIAERSWTRRIGAKCLVNDAAVNGIQRQLAAIRAQAALWIGEGDYPSLIAYGFYKDFSQTISLHGVSTCSLSITGLPAVDVAVPSVDPAAFGASDFEVVRPAPVVGGALAASSVPENDYPAYSPATTYVAGARVILAATHRAYESLTAGNLGNDPATDAGHWLDIGPTNRWAMFDQALGTATTATGSISVQLQPSAAIDTIALLDVVGTSVRVQAPGGYDQTRAIGGDVTSALFLDLAVAAGAAITVTVSGGSAGAVVEVGTLLMGAREGLGTLGDEPTASIQDFSQKDTDDFGLTVPIERGWSKKVEAKSQIATSAADGLIRRMATLRATPALWIGAAEFDALIVYGFFRDFTVTLGEQVSTLGVTIEGMAKATATAPVSTVALTAYLTNEDHTVPADASGNVTSYAGASGTFIIRDGAHEVQSSFNLTAMANPQGLAIAFDGANYAVTGGLEAAEDAATVTIKAVGFGPYSGITATKQFSLSKSKAGGAGSSGAAAKLLSISSNRQTISYDGTGAPTPTDQTINFGVNKQNTAATVYWTITDAAGAPVSLTYLSTPTGDSVYITENNFRLARGSTSGVIVTGSLTDGATLSDSISIVAVRAGAPGADAINGFNRLRNTRFERGFQGWGAGASTGATFRAGSPTTFDTNGLSVMKSEVDVIGGTDGDRSVFFYQDMAVTPGERLALQVGVEGQGAVFHQALYAQYLDSAGNLLPHQDVIGVLAGAQPLNTKMAGFAGVPSGAAKLRFIVSVDAAAAAGFLAGLICEPMVSSATAAQTAFPSYSPGVADGLDGQDGLPGPPGANGQPSYVHIAYANSADGTADFHLSDPSGRAYIGVYTDSTVADSTNPAAYTWSLIKGANGANGTPGPPGANGQPSYVHIAYANSADGTADFHLSDPSGRAYIGVYTDSTVADSTNPAAYTWSLIKGANGADALSVSLAPSAIPVPCTAGGTPKAALSGAQFRVFKGAADVTASTTYSVGGVSNLSGVSVSSSGAVTVSGITGGTTVLTGYADITATKDGASQSVRLVYNKALDGAAYVDGRANVGAPSSTSYATVGQIDLLMGPAGTIEIDSSGGFDGAGAGTTNVQGTLDYSLNGGGTWTTAASFTGNAAVSGESGDWAGSATLSGSSIGLGSKQTVSIRVQMRKTNTTAFSGFSGSLYVTWKG